MMGAGRSLVASKLKHTCLHTRATMMGGDQGIMHDYTVYCCVCTTQGVYVIFIRDKRFFN